MATQRWRRSLVAIPAILVLLAVATSPFLTLVLVRREARGLVNGQVLGLRSVCEAHLSIASGFQATVQALASPDRQDQLRLVESVEAGTRQVDSALEQYRGTVDDSREEVSLRTLLEQRERYRHSRAAVLALLRDNQTEEAARQSRLRMIPDYARYTEALGALIRLNVEDTRAAGGRLLRLGVRMVWIQGALLVFFGVFVFLVPATSLWEWWRRDAEVVTDL